MKLRGNDVLKILAWESEAPQMSWIKFLSYTVDARYFPWLQKNIIRSIVFYYTALSHNSKANQRAIESPHALFIKLDMKAEIIYIF